MEHNHEPKKIFHPKMAYHPIINGLQKIALYETRNMYYLIGSNSTQTRFRVLKVDRRESEKLVLTDDGVIYSHTEIRKVLTTLQEGNRSDATPGTRLARATSAFGIVGFVRFLQGYYLILVTKRRKVASVGQHSIYKIEDTCIRYIPHESYRTNKAVMEEEQKYLKLFLNVDLKANFYFSYSYDLSNTLQHNLSPPSHSINLVHSEELELFLPDGRYKPHFPADNNYCFIPIPDSRYIWNTYLQDAASNLHPAWRMFITHGFIEQVNISVFGHSYYLTLIARRSRMFAGTRFLKRGCNSDGDVANEVETEQIVFDSADANLPNGKFTSFVQIRGSIPAYWSQDVTKMVPKPPISIQLNDPMSVPAGHHFNRLLKRHGSPILILDLTKHKETKMHEGILGPHLKEKVDQLNLTVPSFFKLDYRRLDMAHLNKLPHDNAMNHLSQYSSWALKKSGVFISSSENSPPVYQTGTVRVNCVDCLDRTNTAQYALGKCALAHQLYALGVLVQPNIPWDTDCTRVLEELYEDHGDTMALQYGGSHLVHRIQTYRHTAKWSSHGSDMMQSLSRYYSNTFSDVEKQQSINVFLGVYVPFKEISPLWDLNSDYLLHNAQARGINPCFNTNTTKPWWDLDLIATLPLPLDIRTKASLLVSPLLSNMFSAIDLYNDFYRPSEMSVLTDNFLQNITSTQKINTSAHFSNRNPFCPRIKANKQIANVVTENSNGRRSSLAPSNSSSDGESSSTEEHGVCPPLDRELTVIGKNENILLKITSANVKVSLVNSKNPGLEWDEINISKHQKSIESFDHQQKQLFKQQQLKHIQRQRDLQTYSEENTNGTRKPFLRDVFPDPYSTYGQFYVEPSSSLLQLFSRHARINKLTCHPAEGNSQSHEMLTLVQESTFKQDSYLETFMPTVDKASRQIYQKSIDTAWFGPTEPSDMHMYSTFSVY